MASHILRWLDLDDQGDTDAIVVTPPETADSLGDGCASSRLLPAAITLTDPQKIAEKYRHWQRRVLMFFNPWLRDVRSCPEKLGICQADHGEQIGLTDLKFGIFLSLHGVLYGVSKFANGFLADRANARVFMVSALIVSALLNLWFSFSTSLILLGLIWVANGWFQGMGFPPCARLMTHWFSPRVATKFSIWNASH